MGVMGVSGLGILNAAETSKISNPSYRVRSEGRAKANQKMVLTAVRTEVHQKPPQCQRNLEIMKKQGLRTNPSSWTKRSCPGTHVQELRIARSRS